jgi:hypothetical protein
VTVFGLAPLFERGYGRMVANRMPWMRAHNTREGLLSRVMLCERYPLPGRAALLIRAGTATSTRGRGEVNAFNVVRIDRPEVAIDCMVWQAAR